MTELVTLTADTSILQAVVRAMIGRINALSEEEKALLDSDDAALQAFVGTLMADLRRENEFVTSITPYVED